MKPKQSEILRALVSQVRKAIPEGGNESDVITYISEPMWKAFLMEMDEDIDQDPVNWNEAEDSTKVLSVFGSLTIVIPSPDLFCISKPMTT